MNPMTAAVDTATALRLYPSLAGLVAIMGHGWRFSCVRDEHRVVIEMRGFKQHAAGQVETIGIWSETNCHALRGIPGEGAVWEMTGALTDVVNGLLNLPAPGAPNAPTLIRARAPRPRLWLPSR
jgi:hypothetical protein